MDKTELIGLMSGTSMDGLDIAHVEFSENSDGSTSFKLLHSENVHFLPEIKNLLLQSDDIPTPQLLKLDKSLGMFYANSVNMFIDSNKIKRSKIQAIASHGQTIYHQPQNGFTLQIGCGTTLAYHTALPVINDFRTKDIVAGGQGAPLVPIGDFALFSTQADAFLNIGGFSNISYKKDGVIRAFDIGPGNLPLNKLSASKGFDYDNNGELARSGEINFFLLDMLNSLEYYQQEGPKSLGTEWLEEHFYPLLKFDREIESNLRTVVEHIAIQISFVLNKSSLRSVMITGGGALNKFLIERISHYFDGKLIIPDKELIEFKEAIIFAFLGYRFLQNKPNNVPSVTGASKEVVGGVLHIPN